MSVHSLRRRLEEALQPEIIEIEDESSRHAGHAAAQSHGGGHFRVRIVAACFRGHPLLSRHRMVHAALGEAFAGDVHALSIQALTPEEAAESGGG